VTAHPDLDYASLTRRGGVRGRLRAASTNNYLVMGGTMGALLVLVTTVVLIGLLATSNATDVGGLVVLAMCFGGGVYVLIGVLREGGRANAFGAFATANDLTLVRGSRVPHYAGSLFADESHAVHQSVRTKVDDFLEVGERFPTTSPGSSRQPNRTELFLRARLTGQATRAPHEHELIDPELHEALSRFAGPYAIEMSGDELTVFGSHELDVVRPGRVKEAFTLINELVNRANATLVASPRPAGPSTVTRPTPSGIPIPPPTRPQATTVAPRRPLTVIGWTLTLLIGGPILIAIIMSALDDHLPRTDTAARVVVSLMIVATIAVIARE